jgi:hypothetical protein
LTCLAADWSPLLPAPRDQPLARIPLSYPTYAEVLVDAAVDAARQLNLKIGWQAQAAQSIS